MSRPLPKFTRPPAAYEAIVREHQGNTLRMGEFLLACGWTIQEAARAVVEWDLYTLAAAIANEQATHEVVEFTKLVRAEKGASAKGPPKQRAQVARSTVRINLRPPVRR